MAHPDEFEAGVLEDYKLYLGFVTNNSDPLKRARCRVRIPGVYEPESDWAWPLFPGAGYKNRGIRAPYAVGSLVALIAEQGDRERLFILGGPTVPDDDDEITPLTVEQAANVMSIKLGRFSITIDGNEAHPALYIRDAGTTDPDAPAAERDPCAIYLDGLGRAITITAKGAVTVEVVAAQISSGTAMRPAIALAATTSGLARYTLPGPRRPGKFLFCALTVT